MQIVPIEFTNPLAKWCTWISFNNKYQVIGIIVLFAFLILIASSFGEFATDTDQPNAKITIAHKTSSYLLVISIIMLVLGCLYMAFNKAPDQDTVYSYYSALENSNVQVKLKKDKHHGKIVLKTNPKQKLAKINWKKLDKIELKAQNKTGKMMLNMLQYLRKQHAQNFLIMNVYQDKVTAHYHNTQGAHYCEIKENNPNKIIIRKEGE